MIAKLVFYQEGSISDGKGDLTRIYDRLRKRDYRTCRRWGPLDTEHRYYVQGVRNALEAAREESWLIIP